MVNGVGRIKKNESRLEQTKDKFQIEGEENEEEEDDGEMRLK